MDEIRYEKRYLLGVDGGSTKTLAVVSDVQGTIVGMARGRGSNWSGEEVSFPMTVVIDTVLRALKQAGLSGPDVQVGVFTLAGADWPEDHERRQLFLQSAGIAKQVIVKNDSFGGLRAGTTKPYGIVIAAGSGFNAAAIAPDGREWAFGYYETYGGARDIAREAFIAILRAEDGRGQPTSLTGLVLPKLGYPTVEAMLRARIANQIGFEQFLSICPLVFTAAVEGDEVASAILVKQGLALAEYVAALARRFEMQDLEFDVVLAGSVFKGQGSLLVDTITHAVQEVAPRASVVKARFEPVIGSLLLAFDSLCIPVTDEITRNLVKTMPRPDFFYTADSRNLEDQTGDYA